MEITLATHGYQSIRIRLRRQTWCIFGMMWAMAALWYAAPAAADDLQWTGEPATIEKIFIRVENPRQRDQSFDWDGMVRDIIGMKRGEILTQKKLSTAVSSLKAFGHVRATTRSSHQGVSITFLLLPYQRIKSINMKGTYPLFQRDVRKKMTIAPGDIYNPIHIMDQANLIEQRYRVEGYISPRVDITWEHNKKNGHIDVSIQIHKGDAYAIGRIRLAGNRSISDTVLKGHMATWRAATVSFGTSRFLATRLDDDIQNLLSYYRNQEFGDVQIDYSIERNSEHQSVDIDVTIDEGHKYIFEFNGNQHFPNRTLKKDLAIFEKGNRGNMGLRRTVQNIRRRYLEAGFADVRVQWQLTFDQDGSSNERRVKIDIQEGKRYIVKQVTPTGNKTLNTETIQAQILTRPPNGIGKGAYVAAVLQEDIAAVGSLYRKHGYPNAQISETVTVEPETQQVTVGLEIDEGPKTFVGQIRVEGDSPIAVNRLMTNLPFKTGSLYLPQTIGEGENALAARIAAKGYPHVEVKSRTGFSNDRTRADILFKIDPGPPVEVGHIFWSGNFRTKNALLRRELKLNKGEPFSLTRVLAAQRRLRELNLFQSVQMRTIGLRERAEKVHLLVTIVEKTSYFYELGAGFQTDKGFYGRTKVGDRNFLGLNKEIRLGGEMSGIGYRWDANVVEPRLLGSRISADMGLFLERRKEFNLKFGIDTQGGILTFSRTWAQRLSTSLGVRYERREKFQRGDDTATTRTDPENSDDSDDLEDRKPRTIWVTTPAVQYDTRDSFIRPLKGGFASLAADISKGLNDSQDDFIKYKLDLRSYHTPRQRLTFAGRALAGYIQPYGADEKIPEDQLFFLGGTADVRGFEENLLRFDIDQDPLGGRLSLSGSIEARYEIIHNWELTLFVDAGTIYNTLSDDNNSKTDDDNDWRWSTGLGLRYITPIGPIGLLYGHKLNTKTGEGNGQFHFSIGYTF